MAKKDESDSPESGRPEFELPNSEILKSLASMLGKLQQGIMPEELLKRAAEMDGMKLQLTTSQTEQAHADRLEKILSTWSNEQRSAFAAVLSGRWLLKYEAFSASEGWGHPDLLRGSLDAVWNHLLGRRLARSQARQFSQQIIENAPDTEDFDAPEALAACEILDRTLDCCLEKNNLDSAVSAAMAACSSLAMLGQGPNYRGDDPAEEERLWQQPEVLQEIEFQTALLAKITPITRFDAATVESLSAMR